MTLAGLLPPLCDRGEMLCDGGLAASSRIPVTLQLHRLSARRHDARAGRLERDRYRCQVRSAAWTLLKIVSAVDDTSPLNFGESLSGWWILLNRFNPWSSASSIPTLTEIQSRLA